MKNPKKILVWMMVALVLTTPLLGIIPPTAGKAYAAPSDDSSVSQQLASYMYMRAVASCISNSMLLNGFNNDIISPNNATEYKWFLQAGYSHKSTYTGYLETDNHDGKQNCGDSTWLSNAYAIWNLGDGNSSDPITNLCFSGFKRHSAGNGQNAADCIGGSDDFARDGHGPEAAVQFEKNVNKQFYGKDGTVAGFPPITAAMNYALGIQSLTQLCGGKPSTIAADSPSVKASDKLVLVTKPDGTTRIAYQLSRNKTDSVSTGVNDDLSERKQSCQSLADMASGANATAYAQSVKDNPNGDDSGIVADASDTDVDTSCGSQNIILKAVNPLDWLSCAIVGGGLGLLSTIDDSITSLLCINESSIFKNSTNTCGVASSGSDTASQNAYYSAWNSFRLIALGLIVIAGLIMILSQALGFEIFDAYTIKKTLPRILIAGIAISLSWQILAFLLALSNALGIGVRSLIYAPFLGSGLDKLTIGGGGATLIGLFGVGAFTALGALGILSFVGTALLGALIAFILLVLRQILIIMLIIFAPIAIAAFVLPNTEKYWKLWSEWLMKALVVFPLITGMIAIGHAFSGVTAQSAANMGTGIGATITSFVALAAYIAPYFVIPFAFRLAGGAIGTLGGIVNDRSRGGFDRLKNFRKGQSEARMQYYGQRIGDRAMQARAGAVRGLGAKMSSEDSILGNNKLGRTATRFASNQIAGLGGTSRLEERMSAVNARTGKLLEDTIATGNDAEIRGLTVNKRAVDRMGREAAIESGLFREDETKDENGNVIDRKRQYKSLGGAWIDESAVNAGHSRWGKDVAAQQKAVSYEMRKAMTDEQVAGISSGYADLAKDQFGMTDTQAQGAWIGAGFENQNQHLEFKNTDIDYSKRTAKLNVKKLAEEAYQKKGSYQLSQMSAHTVKQLETAYTTSVQTESDARDEAARLTASGDIDGAARQITVAQEAVGSADKIRAVAETFMHQLGATPTGHGDDVVPGPPGAGTSRQVSSNGAGAVGEAVYRLAQTTGVAAPGGAPNNPQSPGSPQS